MANKEQSEDELDAFMKNLEEDLKKETPGAKFDNIRNDIEEMDDEETLYKFLEENPTEKHDYDENSDSDNEFYRKKNIIPLEPIDHSKIHYKNFKKNFFNPHNDILSMSQYTIEEIHNDFSISVEGNEIPPPVISFTYFNFDPGFLEGIREFGFSTPTPIQIQSISAALCGRDVIGVSQTGSGKTASYLIPLIIHVENQINSYQNDANSSQNLKDENPAIGKPKGLILAPTRELSLQIELEARKLCKYKILIKNAVGGVNLHKQELSLSEGVDILIATPGRLIDLVKSNKISLIDITIVVLDEADRMFEMGFSAQVMSLLDHTRPDRQCLLFCATIDNRVSKLCSRFLKNAVKITIGDGKIFPKIQQNIVVLKDKSEKFSWLSNFLSNSGTIKEKLKDGSVLIFTNRKDSCSTLASDLMRVGLQVGCIHGDMSQFERDEILKRFSSGYMRILVATNIASRGLNILSIQTVINYDPAKDIHTYIHRIGRTGRADFEGNAYTLITNEDLSVMVDLIKYIEKCGQEVPRHIISFANKDEKFRRLYKSDSSKNSKSDGRRAGLGFKFSKKHTEPTQINMDVPKSLSTGNDKLEALKSKLSQGYKRFQKASTDESKKTKK